MGSKEDVALDKATGPISNADDSRVGWDPNTGQYFLKDEDSGGEVLKNGKRIALVFVGASLGPVHRKGVLQTNIDPAAVRVGEGETLRWIIADIHDQQDTTKIAIVKDAAVVWPFEGTAPGTTPNNTPAMYTAVRDATPPDRNFIETDGGRKAHTGGGSERRKYSIYIEFKENRENNSPTLSALIDPDVVYNPPGF